MANAPQLQSYWRSPLWRYRSLPDVSTGHGWCHGDNPWKFHNDVVVQGTKIVWRSVKPIGNEKEWWATHYGVVYQINFISKLSRTSHWSVHSGSYFFPFDWDLCGGYRQPIARVGGACIHSPRFGQSKWPFVSWLLCMAIHSFFRFDYDDKMKYNYSRNPQKRTGWAENTQSHILAAR